MSKTRPTDRLVEFVQYDVPRLHAGTYTVDVIHRVNQQGPNTFSASRQFAVAGERFNINPAEITGFFPPNLSNGEYAGVLPHVLFTRQTLPWERLSIETEPSAPWLAVLLFDDSEVPAIQKLTAAHLIAEGEAITVRGSDTTGVGRLPARYISYPRINPLDYGESPDEECSVIDVPAVVFSRVAPSITDLPYLAHIRRADTVDGEDSTESVVSRAVVLGNRVPLDDSTSHVFLVSLEHMSPYLPEEDGTPSKALEGMEKVRLTVLGAWSFTANTLGETLIGLLENLNCAQAGKPKVSSLRITPTGEEGPTPPEVQQALGEQATGRLSPQGAQVLLNNAFEMGYVPLEHHLRHAGTTASFYRGPLTPFEVQTAISLPISCPDAANRYNPQTGMFDVSYGAAWQLGQLLALQNKSFSVALYNWRRELLLTQVLQAEQQLVDELLEERLPSVRHKRALVLSQAPRVPEAVVEWLARLWLLHGVPFNYLVPDERMLPPESLRVFYVDHTWMQALIDGAFSIGRSTTAEHQLDLLHAHAPRAAALEAARSLRANPPPLTDHENEGGQVTGFLLRSAAVAGWPKLNANGYADTAGETEIRKLRMARLSDDVLICLFDGVVEMVAVHEPPEQLHCGVEGSSGTFTTTLRELLAPRPGHQYEDSAVVPARTDQQTLMVAQAATNIANKLSTDHRERVDQFTSAEFALEMVKGVVRVEFSQSAS